MNTKDNNRLNLNLFDKMQRSQKFHSTHVSMRCGLSYSCITASYTLTAPTTHPRLWYKRAQRSLLTIVSEIILFFVSCCVTVVFIPYKLFQFPLSRYLLNAKEWHIWVRQSVTAQGSKSPTVHQKDDKRHPMHSLCRLGWHDGSVNSL